MDDDCLPEDVSADDYHRRLVAEARAILADYIKEPRPRTRHPWYLMQQVLLYLAARDAFPASISAIKTAGGKLLSHYRRFADFLGGQVPSSLEERAVLLGIAHTGFGIADLSRLSAGRSVSEEFLTRVDEVSPAIASQLWRSQREGASVA